MADNLSKWNESNSSRRSRLRTLYSLEERTGLYNSIESSSSDFGLHHYFKSILIEEEDLRVRSYESDLGLVINMQVRDFGQIKSATLMLFISFDLLPLHMDSDEVSVAIINYRLRIGK